MRHFECDSASDPKLGMWMSSGAEFGRAPPAELSSAAVPMRALIKASM